MQTYQLSTVSALLLKQKAREYRIQQNTNRIYLFTQWVNIKIDFCPARYKKSRERNSLGPLLTLLHSGSAQHLQPIQRPSLQKEDFLSDYILILKRKFQRQSMSLFFYINNGFAAVATLEQVQGYIQNIGNYYSNNEESFPSSNYPINLPQTDLYSQCEHILPPTQAGSQALQQQPQNLPLPSLKANRRMEKTLEKQILSAKKNSQSNIINQFYSFFSSRQKSQRIVQTSAYLLGKSKEQTDKIVSTFYLTIRLINIKRGRKYVNAAMLLKFFTPRQFLDYLAEMKEMKEKIEGLDFLSIDELCQIFRRCAKYYLKEVSVSAILTSKRISTASKKEHLKKLRKISRVVLAI